MKKVQCAYCGKKVYVCCINGEPRLVELRYSTKKDKVIKHSCSIPKDVRT